MNILSFAVFFALAWTPGIDAVESGAADGNDDDRASAAVVEICHHDAETGLASSRRVSQDAAAAFLGRNKLDFLLVNEHDDDGASNAKAAGCCVEGCAANCGGARRSKELESTTRNRHLMSDCAKVCDPKFDEGLHECMESKKKDKTFDLKRCVNKRVVGYFTCTKEKCNYEVGMCAGCQRKFKTGVDVCLEENKQADETFDMNQCVTREKNSFHGCMDHCNERLTKTTSTTTTTTSTTATTKIDTTTTKTELSCTNTNCNGEDCSKIDSTESSSSVICVTGEMSCECTISDNYAPYGGRNLAAEGQKNVRGSRNLCIEMECCTHLGENSGPKCVPAGTCKDIQNKFFPDVDL